jgi:hypothetical protein
MEGVKFENVRQVEDLYESLIEAYNEVLIDYEELEAIDDDIQELRNTTLDKYDYSLVEWKGGSFPIVVICKKHGKFNILPYEHRNKKECYKLNRSKNDLNGLLTLLNNKISNENHYTSPNEKIDLNNSIKEFDDFFQNENLSLNILHNWMLKNKKITDTISKHWINSGIKTPISDLSISGNLTVVASSRNANLTFDLLFYNFYRVEHLCIFLYL